MQAGLSTGYPSKHLHKTFEENVPTVSLFDTIFIAPV